MKTTPHKHFRTTEELWSASREAERDRDISRAIELHEIIMAYEDASSLAFVRAGWLHYQAGGYSRALEFYQKAADFPNAGIVPFRGIMDCLAAMGYVRKNANYFHVFNHLQQSAA